MVRPTPRTLGYLAAWLGAAVVAVAVGLFAVTGVGASVRDRGPLTGQAQAVEAALADQEGFVTPDPDAERTSRVFEGEYGSFTVSCQGAVAYGDAVDPAPGWRALPYEQGPDDDIDVLFASGNRSIELEVYCNDGEATISDREVKTLPDEDD
ncbi:hypothetical protein GCM10023340_31770 [Nocardioides marinquilinus]|uniref:Septum formation initiator n=1 Tax=Nocardioides marinquilinus TaxID=1210400 RepID=A0ABP9PXZ0_9ACTN